MGELDNQTLTDNPASSEGNGTKKLPATASLYVGDLHPDVTEAMIYDKFSKIGPVLSIRVCRDMITRKSLGYAYVNFQSHNDAEQALEDLNFECIHERPIRIMWSQRDPAVRKSGVGNIFIKNLDKSITSKELNDTFQNFGHILSVKISQDELGNSKGYGFVHFESEEAAQKAIDTVNGKLIKDKQVYVGKFIPRSERGIKECDAKFTNCYIKNFGDNLTEQQILDIFEPYGDILSAKVMENDDGKSKGFGFVSFKDPECAYRACEALNNSEINGRTIYVGRAQKKSERLIELKHKFEKKNDKSPTDVGTVNLYIKNLEDEIDDEHLRLMFSEFGNITSAKVMTDSTGRSRGFGFVCFGDVNGAMKAVSDMNGKLIGSKPLYVANAQKKEDRQQHLLNIHSNRFYSFGSSNVPFTISNGYNTVSAMSNSMVRPAQYNSAMPGASLYSGQSQLAAMRSAAVAAAANRWNSTAPSHPNMLTAASLIPANNRMNNAAVTNMMRTVPITANNTGTVAMGSARPILGPQQPVAVSSMTNANRPIMSSQTANPNIRYMPTPTPTSIGGYAPMKMNVSPHVMDGNSQMSRRLPKECDEKNNLGEQLFARVKAFEPTLAGKITGMLLERDDVKKISQYVNDTKFIEQEVKKCVDLIYKSKNQNEIERSNGCEESNYQTGNVNKVENRAASGDRF